MTRKRRPPVRITALHALLRPKRTKRGMSSWQCLRCGHKWVPRFMANRKRCYDAPLCCPYCHRRNWWIEYGVLQKPRKDAHKVPRAA